MLKVRNRVEVIIYNTHLAKVLVAYWKKQDEEIAVFPGGGVEENESVEEATVKECLEEVGIRVKDVIVLTKGPIKPIPDSDLQAQTKYRGDQTIYVAARFSDRDYSKYNCEGDAMPFTWETPLAAAALVNGSSFDGFHRAQAMRDFIMKRLIPA